MNHYIFIQFWNTFVSRKISLPFKVILLKFQASWSNVQNPRSLTREPVPRELVVCIMHEQLQAIFLKYLPFLWDVIYTARTDVINTLSANVRQTTVSNGSRAGSRCLTLYLTGANGPKTRLVGVSSISRQNYMYCIPSTSNACLSVTEKFWVLNFMAVRVSLQIKARTNVLCYT